MRLPQLVKQFDRAEFAESATEGRWVLFEFCISCIAVTFRRTSRPTFIKPGSRAWVHGLPYSLVSLFAGWWGVPWGFVYTPVTIFSNLTGGSDITAQIRESGCAAEREGKA